MFDLDRWEEIWQTINRNRKRSIMTAFGVFWGIFMLTVMMGSGLGLRNLLYANLNGMNENSCFLWGGKTSAIPRVSSRFCRNGCCSAVSSTKSTWSSSARSA